MTTKCGLLTSIFIAATAITTWATAENVYKCGNTYRQSPCPGGKLLSIDDSRDPQQKKLKDEVTRRDAELAKDMEKTRLANEEALRAAEAKPTVTEKTTHQILVVEPAPTVITPKRLRHKTIKHKDFVALTPGSEQKPVKQRTVRKTVPDLRP